MVSIPRTVRVPASLIGSPVSLRGVRSQCPDRFLNRALAVLVLLFLSLCPVVSSAEKVIASPPFTLTVDTISPRQFGAAVSLRVTITPNVPCDTIALEIVEADHLTYSGPSTLSGSAAQGQPTEFSLPVVIPHNDTSGFVFNIQSGERGQTTKVYWVTVGDSVVTYPGNPRLYPVPVEGRDPIDGKSQSTANEPQYTITHSDSTSKIVVITTDSAAAKSSVGSDSDSDSVSRNLKALVRSLASKERDTVSYSGAEGKQALLADIDRAAELDNDAFDSLAESIVNRVNLDTAGVAAVIIPRLSEPQVGDKKLLLYVAVLAVTQAQEAVDDICQIAQNSESEALLTSGASALGRIGGEKAGDCIMSILDRISNPEVRFKVFEDLGQMQFSKALPAALEVLKSDAKEHYWRPIFVFGKMGDMAVPHLITKVNDSDFNVRFNAINVLGQWLIAPEAAEPLMNQFWIESDPKIRTLILSSLEMTADAKSAAMFMKKVADKSKDKEAVKFAKEAIDIFKGMKDEAKTMQQMKQVSAADFRTVYDSLWQSYGRGGDYSVLATSSALEDEPALKRLRERILQRDSDEAFYDYKGVSRIIYVNRLLYSAQ